MARCAMKAMLAQGALSEFMRKTSLTTEPPISGRRLGCSEDIDPGIRADLRRLYLYGRRITIIRSGVKNHELRPLIVRRIAVGRIHFFRRLDEMFERQ